MTSPSDECIPVRGWPTIDDLAHQLEVLHALSLWRDWMDRDGELPSFAEVGGIEVWAASEQLVADTRNVEVSWLEQRLLVRAMVLEVLANYVGDIDRIRHGLLASCCHPGMAPTVDQLLEELGAT